MIKINLLPVRAAQKKEKLFSQVFVLVAGLLVIIAGCGFVHFSLTGKIADQREENQRIQSELSSLRKKIGQVGKFKKLKKDLEGKLAVLKKLKDAKSGPVHLLDELTMALPEKIWIDSYRESSG
nr:fimbrial protein [candidate division KSB1 bacterium]NIW73113.1 fimbrial protein [candidate division KSB1 bacterium]